MLQSFIASRGRIALNLQIVPMGRDIQILITGGSAHIGAVAVASGSSPQTAVHEISQHREGELAQKIACRLARALHVTVGVSAGIHFNDITREEIVAVLELADSLAQDALQFLLSRQ